MEDVLSKCIFLIFLLPWIFRKPITNLIDRWKFHDKEIAGLNEKISRLEALCNNVTDNGDRLSKELQDLRDSGDVSFKMIIDCQRSLATAKPGPNLHFAESGARQFSRSKDSSAKILTTSAPQAGDFGKVVNDHTIRFERIFPASSKRLFKFLTESQHLIMWLGQGDIEEHFGGKVDIVLNARESINNQSRQIRGFVTHCEPNKSIAFSWVDSAQSPESIVSIELSGSGSDTQLILTHSRLESRDLHNALADWHVRLDVLMARLRNAPPPDFIAQLHELKQVYITMLAAMKIAESPYPGLASNSDYQTISL